MTTVHDDATPYPELFRPFELAGQPLRNRIVHAAILTSLAERGRVTDRLVNYYANRAKGGAAMIVTEPVGALPRHQTSSRVCAWDDSELAGLARLADSVESQGCRLLAQIQDPGRGRHVGGRNTDAIGASAMPDDLSWTMPRELSGDEVLRVIDAFAAAAARLYRCGYSGVEISAGHGHLWHQFLSPWSNLRTDLYGGDLVNRARIVTQLIDAIRAMTGRGFIIGVKFPGDDGVAGGVDVQEACRIATHLAATGQVDYLCPTQGSHGRSLEMHMPTDHYPRVPYRALIGQLRHAVPDMPMMALARITDPAEADGLLTRGVADLVGLGRALITDPGWPLKAAQGRARDIRYCVAANNCWNTIIHQKPIACDNNPRVGEPDELDWAPSVVQTRKNVVIVGAGIAGLEAAWIAAARGHAVTLLGRSPEVGGSTRLHAQLPASESLSSIYDWQWVAAQRAGVRAELGVEATLENILALQPDEVILATGSRMTWPRLLPSALAQEGIFPDLRQAMKDLLARQSRQPGCAVLFDMDQTEGTYAAAYLLAERFERLVLVTPRDGVAQETPLVSRQMIQRRLHELKVEVRTLCEPWISPDFMNDAQLGYVSIFGGTPVAVEDAVFFSWSTPRRPNDALREPLLAAGVAVRLIGDCRVAGSVMQATSEGHRAGHAV